MGAEVEFLTNARVGSREAEWLRWFREGRNALWQGGKGKKKEERGKRGGEWKVESGERRVGRELGGGARN